MTNERAIEILDPEHREHYKSIEPIKTACRMGMDALQKQMPKNPIMEGTHYACFEEFFCPSCKKRIISRLDGNWIAGRLQKYCDECGQALDWEKSEVVRCKKCKYWQDNNGGYPHEECCWNQYETPCADDYCSYGEKMDGDKA